MISKSLFLIAAILLGSSAHANCRRQLEPHSDDLTDEHLRATYKQVFGVEPLGQKILIMTDLPHGNGAGPYQSNPHWDARVATAMKWKEGFDRVGAEARLLFYPVTENNAALPRYGYEYIPGEGIPTAITDLTTLPVEIVSVLQTVDTVFAPTESSATAPLTQLAAGTKLRGVTLPGWNSKMIPALRLQPGQVKARCLRIAEELEQSDLATFQFEVANGSGPPDRYTLKLDLRFRKPRAGFGQIENPGDIHNLPGGETYIVPYEGERPNIPSISEGVLPMERNGEVILYKVENNRVTQVLSKGKESEIETAKLKAEPAYGNIAEIGFGVLGGLGIKPSGFMLLDEKLTLHIAFGRSEHLGGAVSAANFKLAANVIHIDYVYLPESQPQIRVRSVVLNQRSRKFTIMQNGDYVPNLFRLN